MVVPDAWCWASPEGEAPIAIEPAEDVAEIAGINMVVGAVIGE